MTKRIFIELVQDRLSGGDATMDVQGKFSYAAIEQTTNIVLSDIVSKDRGLVEQFAVSNSYTVNSNKVLLNPKPIVGTKGIVFVNSEYGMIPVSQGLGESSIMSIIMPQMVKSVKSLVGSYLFFTGIPDGTVVEVILVPDFAAMDEDSNFIVEDNFEVLLRKVMEIMQPLSTEEIKDDSVKDTDKPQA